MPEAPTRKFDPGVGLLRDMGVAKEGENRVVKRRGGNLNLTPLRCLAISFKRYIK